MSDSQVWRRAKVWNRNSYVYSESFEGEDISIEPGEFVIMPRSKAISFKGTMNNVKINADGRPKPETYKIIELEPVFGSVVEAPAQFICAADGKKLGSQAELDAYVNENHSEKLVDKKIAVKLKDKFGG